MRVPGQEPACEDGRLEALFDDQRWCAGVPAAGVSAQVLPGCLQGALLLCGLGLGPDPQEHLSWERWHLNALCQGLSTRPDHCPSSPSPANHSLRDFPSFICSAGRKVFPRIGLVFVTFIPRVPPKSACPSPALAELRLPELSFLQDTPLPHGCL